MQKDYFSRQSESYLRFRPTYPKALFKWLTRDLKEGSLIWDCATGNGQAAISFGKEFKVIATDQSRSQLNLHLSSENILYVQAPAEVSPFPAASISLITVAQALHWFNFDLFFDEVERVLKPRGVIAAWTYSFLTASPQLGVDIDNCVREFYQDVVGPYWPPERTWVDKLYETIPFPFLQLPSPTFEIEVFWNLDHLIGYVSSWSAVGEYKKAGFSDPIPLLRTRLNSVWGKRNKVRQMRWVLGLRVGTVRNNTACSRG